MKSLPIKRQKFSQAIRRDKIESFKRQVRLSLRSQLHAIDQKKFIQLINSCKQTQFSQRTCQIFIDYLFLVQIHEFQLKKLIKVLQQYLKYFGRKNIQSVGKVSSILKKIILLILKQQEKLKNDKLINMESIHIKQRIIQYLFQQIVSCMLVGAQFIQIFNLWQQLFQISHKQISLLFFRDFQFIIQSNSFQIQSKRIDIIICCLANFTSHQLFQHLNIQVECSILKTIEVIYQSYQLGEYQILQVLQSVKNLIFAKDKTIIEIRVRRLFQINMFSNLKSCLKDQNQKIVLKALQIIIKIFSIDDSQILESIMLQNSDILCMLRELLPVRSGSYKKTYLKQQMIQETNIEPFNRMIVNNAIVAISNIVATKMRFVEIFLIRGIKALVILFNNTDADIRQNISYVLYNLCMVGSAQHIQTMVQSQLLDMVLDLIKQQKCQDAVLNGLAILKHILHLQTSNHSAEDRNNSSQVNRMYALSMSKWINCLKVQFQQNLNSILFRDNKFQKEASQCLQLLDVFEKNQNLIN